MSKDKAVILLSGGLDSSTMLYFAKNKGYSCYCLIFDYGQRHRKEIKSAKIIAQKAGATFRIIKFRFPFKSSSLLDRSKNIPFHTNLSYQKTPPSTYVPGRNTVFISFALSYAEAIKAKSIFIGANAVDFSGYPDCRPKYYKSFQNLLYSLGKKIKILTPLLKLSKEQIVELGTRLKVPFKYTWSCYKGSKKPCGICDSCRFRQKGFFAAKLKDPAK